MLVVEADCGKESTNRREADAALGGAQSCFCPPRHSRRKPAAGAADRLGRPAGEAQVTQIGRTGAFFDIEQAARASFFIC